MIQTGSNTLASGAGGEASRNATGELATGFERPYFDHAPVMRRVAKRRFRIPDAEADALVHDIFATWLANPSVVRGGPPTYILSVRYRSLTNGGSRGPKSANSDRFVGS